MNRWHLLFVEDDPTNRLRVSEYLKKWFAGYKIDTAASFSEAKKTLRTCLRQGYVTRVVIVDELLKPDGRGSDFLAYVHARHPGIRKVMLAARAEVEDLSKAINKGHLDRYILKDRFNVRHTLLRDAIREALEKDQGFIYEAVAAILTRAEEAGGGKQPVLVAGKEEVPAGKLLQHIMLGSKLGRDHMRYFAELVYNAFEQPNDFFRELARVEKLRRQKRRAASSTSRKRTQKRRAKS